MSERLPRDAFSFDYDEPEPTPRERALDLLTERIGEAIYEGDDAAVRRMVVEGAELLGEYGGLTSDLMMQAARAGRVGATAALLEAGAEADRRCESGGTALISAAWNGHLEVVRMLLEAGADPDAAIEEDGSYGDPHASGECALYCALYKGHHDLTALLEPITSPEMRMRAHEVADERVTRDAANTALLSEATTQLFMAAKQGRLDLLREAIAAGADLDAELPPDASNKQLGSTPLSFAAGRGRIELVEAILEAGADPGLASHGGLSPADFADLNGHPEIAHFLRSNL